MDVRHVGRVLRAIRESQGRTQGEVADAARVSQSALSRVERGMVGHITMSVLDRITSALDASLFVDVRYRGGMADRLLDRVHAALVDHVVAQLRDGWEVIVEFTFNEFGERGSVDILAWHAGTRTLLIIEVKSRFTDLQAMLASFGRKVRLVPGIVARERGWRPVAVGRVLVASGTSANRAIVDEHAAIFRSAFPSRALEIRPWLRAPTGAISGVWFVSTGVVPTLREIGRQRRGARGS
jgi:transcriptional regulator with XRE-family HTH domain